MPYSGPRNPNPADNESRIVIYGYVPALAVGIAGVACFLVLFVAHFGLIFWRRITRTFQILLALGCAMEVIGYGFRTASHHRPFVINSFIIQYFTIVCAPVFFSAAFYLALSSILKRTDNARRYSPVAPGVIVKVFVVADVLTIAVQVLGASLAGVAASKEAKLEDFFIASEDANHILLAGLCVQSAAFLVYLLILAVVIHRLHKGRDAEMSHSSRSITTTSKISARPPTLLLFVISASSLLIFLRTIFRVAETAEGFFGSLSSDEGYFTGLEFVPVVIALALWVAYPLAKGLQAMEKDRVYLGHEVEMTGPSN